MEYHPDIFAYIKEQEAAYKLPIRLTEGWSWNMYEHIRTSYLYTNSQLTNGKDDFTPVKNITRPITNVQKRATGFDVKDIVLYVDDPKDYYKSFFIKKFHENWARKNNLDTFIDQLVESYVDFGGALIKNVNSVRPEVVPLQSLVFCDQTDILSGPIGIRHYYSPDQLLEMAENGWGETSNGATCSLKDAIRLARSEKRTNNNEDKNDTPGKYIEVYEVHGQFPKSFLNSTASTEDYENQLHIVCFYQKAGERHGVTLYKAREKKSPFKMVKRDPVFGRALGFGGAEELFEAQVWTNADMIRIQDMLDAASKTIMGVKGSNTAAILNGQKMRDMDNLHMIDLGPDGEIGPIDTFARNLKLFEQNSLAWEQHAQQMGAAGDAIMGEQPSAGTPFKLQELITQESHGLHEYRKGQIATFLDEVYRDWVIPHLMREATKGQKFLAELDMEELRYVMDALVSGQAHRAATEMVLNGELVDEEAIEQLKEQVRTDFQKKGNKHFLEILKGELKDAPVAVKTNIVGKQKNLAMAVDKIVNVFRFAFSNPQGFAQTMQIPGMARAFNQILEFSGLSPVDFMGIEKMAMAQEPEQAQQPQLPQQAPAMV